MEDCLRDMIFSYSLEMMCFTLGSSHTIKELHIWIASFWLLSNLLDGIELCCSNSTCTERCCKQQLSKLCSWIYSWDGVQKVILWIKKCFFYEDPREKFFSAQQDENLQQLSCPYLVGNMVLLTEYISLYTLLPRKCTAHSGAHL